MLDYGALASAVGEVLDRGDLADRYRRFIEEAHLGLQRLRPWRVQESGPAELALAGRTAVLPADFLRPRGAALVYNGASTELHPAGSAAARDWRRLQAEGLLRQVDATLFHQRYIVESQALVLLFAPVAGSRLYLTYDARLDCPAADESDWFLANGWDALKWAAAAVGAEEGGEDGRASRFRALRDEKLAELIRVDQQAGATYRSYTPPARGRARKW